ncbi:hypothetical protein CEUSTIGMA_g4032.t1 [Chlamydomonas eustigma]|uniref:Mandelate racemase/muconate lactonizing enzyme C-terminal domain-containing protein n=1 Tax=Chlamydomonas eustigma TaxID=1157962 RepID=A0A250X0K9_9CHLO|nr:hypothetical protein CEUSTIGMA_g4032.t1 [Chlamydomonas eustigma]|eukprot:GAX76586.1 hypothetical protein CEUSTIGMA_g4032.t1 [Chlamydomonas eustigma]
MHDILMKASHLKLKLLDPPLVHGYVAPRGALCQRMSHVAYCAGNSTQHNLKATINFQHTPDTSIPNGDATAALTQNVIQNDCWASSTLQLRSPSSQTLNAVHSSAPVLTCKTVTLQGQTSLSEAIEALCQVITLVEAKHGVSCFSSGVIRIEVPVPRGCTALRWLQGQASAQTAVGQAVKGLAPHLYFSGRHSSTPDGQNSSQAEACTKGWSAVAGVGAAWLWHGKAGSGFDAATTVQYMQRFLSASCPRVRVIGGTRFNPDQLPATEWEAFGSYCFALPLIEYTEAANCCLLAVTLAWDRQQYRHAAAGTGAGSAEEACQAAADALKLLRPPALPTAYALHLSSVEEPVHTPDKAAWHAQINTLLNKLEVVGCDSKSMVLLNAEGVALDSTGNEFTQVDRELAWQEFASNAGQQGLDSLLSVLKSRSPPPSASNLDKEESLSYSPQLHYETDGSLPGSTSGPGGVGWGMDDIIPPTQVEEGVTFSKVVAARRTDIRTQGQLDPLYLLEAVQDKDPRAYQVYLGKLPGKGGEIGTSCFLASTPERLYVRTGRHVASEAVAATRPRGAEGDIEKDFWYALDLLNNPKDHVEFTLVRDWIEASLRTLSESVNVEVPKSILKQGAVQHLYGRLAAELKPSSNDGHLLKSLHPTPAVCGRPRRQALGFLAEEEGFDRGYYSGPFGWISGEGAEFVVAIRSALVQQEQESTPGILGTPLFSSNQGSSSGKRADQHNMVRLFAGVGVVVGSDPSAEWQELDLKMRQYRQLLLPPRLLLGMPNEKHLQVVPHSSARALGPWLRSLPNINMAWCSLMVEEMCREGVTMFCVAPGSRSSPLTLAIAMHPRARLNVCIDERSLGFWALGYSRATGKPAAVVTSSGTAVANLLPAVIEACMSHVPLLLLTADRPPELRDTAANQTIDQVKIFGSFTRWAQDVAPPLEGAGPGRTILTTVAAAVRHAVASPAGPVHLNMQFREPLAPSPVPWNPSSFLKGIESWLSSTQPFTMNIVTNHALHLRSGSYSATKHQLHPQSSSSHTCSPEAASLVALLMSARRGLLVVNELVGSKDTVAVMKLAELLGWPVAADVLSGIRVGWSSDYHTSPWSDYAVGTAQSPGMLMNTAVYENVGRTLNITRGLLGAQREQQVIHHMDHLLLGGSSWWACLKPDVILQVGSHGTSKRLAQFLEWSAQDSSCPQNYDVQRLPASKWIHVADHNERHDPSHLVTHRISMSIQELTALLHQAIADDDAHISIKAGISHSSCGDYFRLLRELDSVAGFEIDKALQSIPQLNEPQVSRHLSRHLPPGHGLFLGGLASGHTSHRVGVNGVGVPVAANRGASGIDGVLSTAAGYAEGLARPVTLVVGDLSFLHDINGLNMLRTRESRPPLTVVLINNKGGAIFSFLPISGEVGTEQFSSLWATPQNVDLEGMCRAQGIPHQRVTTSQDLHRALTAAWGLNRHSVVEVITDRGTNLDFHRKIQGQVSRATQAAYSLMKRPHRISNQNNLIPYSSIVISPLRILELTWQRYSLPLSQPLTTASATQQEDLYSPHSVRSGIILRVSLASSGSDADDMDLLYQESLPRALGSDKHLHPGSDLESSDHCLSESNDNGLRGSEGDDVINYRSGARILKGVGEVAPLPGLHRESLEEAEVQLALISELLRGVSLPRSISLLGGRLEAWLDDALGFRATQLFPSVRFALESCLLSAIAVEQGLSLSELIKSTTSVQASAVGSSVVKSGGTGRKVVVSGLLSPGVDESVESVTARAVLMVKEKGYVCLKIKVARKSRTPEQDAELILAIRASVGNRVELRADANRGWCLQEAVRFGLALQGTSQGSKEEEVEGSPKASKDGPKFQTHRNILAYVEEPTQSASDWLAFYDQTGVPVAADESLDDGTILKQVTLKMPPNAFTMAPQDTSDHISAAVIMGDDPASDSDSMLQSLGAGLAALVVKPSVLGSWEGVERLVEWGRTRESAPCQVIVSSSFESSCGLSILTQLAASLSPTVPSSQSCAATSTSEECLPKAGVVPAQGLGTLHWFRSDVVDPPLQISTAVEVGSRELAAASINTLESSEILLSLAHAHRPSLYTPGSLTDNRSGICPSRHTFFSKIQVSVRVEGCNARRYHFTGSRLDSMPAPPPSFTTLTPSADASIVSANKISSVKAGSPAFLFLHGFLGKSEDWKPFMVAAAAAGRSAVALNLPGHGGTSITLADDDHGREEGMRGSQTKCGSVEEVADAVAEAISSIGITGCVLVGYSLGARVALAVGARHPDLVSSLVLISGSAGEESKDTSDLRAIRDDQLADALELGGLSTFIPHWYAMPMWESLRRHPRYRQLLQRRMSSVDGASGAGDRFQLASALRGMRTGRMEPLGSALRSGHIPPTTLVVGALDSKFVQESSKMFRLLNQSSVKYDFRVDAENSNSTMSEQQRHAESVDIVEDARKGVVEKRGRILHSRVVIPDCGHAVHIEEPLALMKVLMFTHS